MLRCRLQGDATVFIINCNTPTYKWIVHQIESKIIYSETPLYKHFELSSKETSEKGFNVQKSYKNKIHQQKVQELCTPKNES